MSEKLPWFKFWVQDFLTDEAVIRMSNESIGVYLRMLCHQWLEGSIPSEHEVLAKMTYSTPQVVREVLSMVDDKYSKDGNRLVHKRLEKDRAGMISQQEGRIKGAKKRGLQLKVSLRSPEGKLRASNSVSNSSYQSKQSKKSSRSKFNVNQKNLSDLCIEFFPEPDRIEAAESIWSWISYKSERSSVYKETGLRSLVKRLAGWGLRRSSSAIEFSMAQGYLGLYEEQVKGENGRSTDPGVDEREAKRKAHISQEIESRRLRDMEYQSNSLTGEDRAEAMRKMKISLTGGRDD